MRHLPAVRALSVALLALLAACGGTQGTIQLAASAAAAEAGQDFPAAPVGETGAPSSEPNTAVDPNQPVTTPVDPAHPDAGCGVITAVGSCDANAWVHCSGTTPVRTDCAAAGQRCEVGATGVVGCVATATVPVTPVPPTTPAGPILTIPAFDIAGHAVTVEVLASRLLGTGIAYDLRLAGRAYVLSCAPGNPGRSCTVADAQAPLLTIGFAPGVGLAVASPTARLGGAWGPTVLRAQDLAQVRDPAAFVLLDVNVLGQLPEPPAAETALAAAYASLLGGDAAVTWDTVRFRLDLQALSAGQRSELAALIGRKLSDAFVMEHMMITHQAGWLVPGGSVGGTTYAYGGFTNGHRKYIREMEATVRDQSASCPFRRLPAWDPATQVPAEFMLNLTNPNINLALPATYQLSRPDLLRTFASDDAFGLSLNGWHNNVHNAGGGAFAVVMTASRAPLFFCWHQSVDTLWDGYRMVTQLR